MVSLCPEVKTAIAEEVRIAMTAETQRMSAILEEKLGQASVTIQSNMKSADDVITAKLTQSEAISNTIMQQSEALRVQCEAMTSEIGVLQLRMKDMQTGMQAAHTESEAEMKGVRETFQHADSKIQDLETAVP